MTADTQPRVTPRKLGEGRYRFEIGQPAYMTKIFKDGELLTNVMGFRCEQSDGLTTLVLHIVPESVEIIADKAAETTKLARIDWLIENLSTEESGVIVDALVAKQQEREKLHRLRARFRHTAPEPL